MITYLDNYEYASFDGHMFKRDNKTGYFLSAKEINGRRKRLHIYIWEYYNGDVPKGYHVHHIDHDKNNNEIDNLMLITAKEHASLHGNSWSEERRDKQLKILREKAIPEAVKWHKSEESTEWHKKHYEATKEKLHEKSEFVCDNCGKKFVAEVTGKNRFCSNKCKSMYRRKSGVDNETRKCICCGKEFTTNKYSKARTCSRKCAYSLRGNKKNT